MVYKSLYGHGFKMTSWFPLLGKLYVGLHMLKEGFTVTLLWFGVVVYTVLASIFFLFVHHYTEIKQSVNANQNTAKKYVSTFLK